MNMIELSQNEKEQSIEDILAKGIVKPKSLLGYLNEIYRALGIRHLFGDVYHGIAMAVVLTIGLLLLYLMNAFLQIRAEKHIYTTLFAVAPIFFFCIVLSAEVIEKVNGLYELKMTCKYTIQQITAFRVLCFSLLGALFCALTSFYLGRLSSDFHFSQAFSLSLFALFLCAFLSIFVMRCFRWKWIHFSVVLFWSIASMLPAQVGRERWEVFLSQIPTALIVAMTVVAFALFLNEIKKLMKYNKREVAYYAGC